MHDYQPLKILKADRETPEAIALTLEIPAELRATYRFRPGQHLPVRATVDGEELRRTYSICCGPDEATLRIAIKRIADGRFSHWANANLKVGQALEAMPPAGRFILPEGDGNARQILAFAAGAGITPILAMLRHALEREPDSSFTLVYGNRAPATVMFREELEDLKDRHLGRFTLLHVLSHNEESSAPLFEGRITGDKVKTLTSRLFNPEEIAHAFLCGPGTLIKDARNALLELGIPRTRIHHEFFAPAGGRCPPLRRQEGRGEGQPQMPAPAQASAPHSITLPTEERGEGIPVGTQAVAILDGMRHRFTIPPGERVVDAALAAGIRVPYSCKGGMCCTCRAKLIEGEAEMVTNYSLEPWEIERGFILTCQALPKSDRLVVDYDQM
jgi:ring-1,2-phenylacetyl-CoA epoxidase subunit PaaE